MPSWFRELCRLHGGTVLPVSSPSVIRTSTREPSGALPELLHPDAKGIPNHGSAVLGQIDDVCLQAIEKASHHRCVGGQRRDGHRLLAKGDQPDSIARPLADEPAITPLTTDMRVTCWPSLVKSSASIECEASTASIRS